MRCLVVLATVAALTTAAQAEVVRHKDNPDSPILLGATVKPGATLTFLSGQVPPVIDRQAPADSPKAYGDTKTQTIGVLNRIRVALEGQGLGLGDVVKMTVFLVGDPAKGGTMDFAGMMAAYREAFGTAAQPNLPVRSTVQVAALANPGWLVEIEVTAVRARR